MLNQFMEKSASYFGLEAPPSPDDTGEYLLLLEPDLEILLRENAAPGITLFTTLAPLPEEKKEDFLLFAMSANLFGKETGSNFLGCDSEGKLVTLTTFLPQEANYRNFIDAIEEFANYAEAWRQECIEYAK